MYALNICLRPFPNSSTRHYNDMFVPITNHVYCPLKICWTFIRNSPAFSNDAPLNNGAQKDACVGQIIQRPFMWWKT